MYLSTGARGVSGWTDIFQQVAQAGADFVTHEATGVATYGGAPAYTSMGGTYSPTPAPVIVEQPGPPAWLLPTAAVAGAVGLAKLLGLF